MPTPDKIRPWLHIYCSRWPDCEFTTKAEWEGLRHQDETGHSMDWPGERLPRSLPTRETRHGREEKT